MVLGVLFVVSERCSASSSRYRGLCMSVDACYMEVENTHFFGLQQNLRRSSGRMKCGSRT